MTVTPPLAITPLTIGMVAADIGTFAGAGPGQADDVVWEGTGDLELPEPPTAGWSSMTLEAER